MSHRKIQLSRRGLFKGALALGGAAIGSRIAGPIVGNALAAPEPSHFVHIFFNGGFNALFAGNADKYVSGNVFDVTSSNIKDVGDGVFTDASTFGMFPQIALDHWAALGMKHGQSSHTVPNNINGGGERAILLDGSDCALNKLAAAMGGDSPFKAVHFGDRLPAYKQQPAFQGVSLERITSISDAVKTIGGGLGGDDAAKRGREESALDLEASLDLGKKPMTMNPTRLGPLADAYRSAAAAFRKPQPAITVADITSAYGLKNPTNIDSFGAMLAGAELMIRGAGTNVVNITDLGFASWDFHQTGGGGKSLNGMYSRRKFLGEGGFGKENRAALVKTFLERMLNIEGRNVVVALSGEMVRLPSGDHGDGTVAAVFGKRLKRGVSFGVDERSRFAQGTPPPRGFWAAIATACGVQGQPFGANPHSLIG